MNTKERVETMLGWVQREGMDKLIEWLEQEGYFESPASTKYHGVYEGGLIEHSMKVYDYLRAYNEAFKLEIPQDSMIIAALLHDVCKIGAYIPANNGKYNFNKEHPKGHGALSVERVKQFIELTELEEKMILYHMGVYGLEEFEPGKGEYPLRGGGLANAWYHHPAVKVIYICDELATLSEKAGE